MNGQTKYLTIGKFWPGKVKPYIQESATVSKLHETIVTTIVDLAAISERLAGNSDWIKSAVKVFIRDIPEQLEIPHTHILAGDVSQAVAQAHKIQGVSINVGGMALGALARRQELAGKAGDLHSQNLYAIKMQ